MVVVNGDALKTESESRGWEIRAPPPTQRNMAKTPTRPTPKSKAIKKATQEAIHLGPGVDILPALSEFKGWVEDGQDKVIEPPAPADYSRPPVADAPEYPGHPDADPVMAIATTPHPGTAEGRLARRTAALEMRIQGKGYHEIAALLGVTYKTAYYDVQESLVHLGRYHTHLAEDVRTVELTRLDVMTQALWPAVMKGSTYAIDTALKVMGRRAAMLGLDFKDQMAGEDSRATVPGRDSHHLKSTGGLHKLSNEELQQRLVALRARVESYQPRDNGADGGPQGQQSEEPK